MIVQQYLGITGMHIIQAHPVLRHVQWLQIYGAKIQRILVNLSASQEVLSTTLLGCALICVLAVWMMMGHSQIKGNVMSNA